MIKFRVMKRVLATGVVGLMSTIVVPSASANHSWNGYHWARQSNPFTVKLGDNVSSGWDSYLTTASSQWSQSDVLDTTVVTGQAKANCRPTSGRVEVCNKAYGNNGWLGIAQIWVSGSHITQGTVKMNDTYFASSSYNTQGWKSLVMCQEIGHTFGLAHQDEDYNNPPIVPHTCMDYFVPGTNETVGPNQHDYDELDVIYSHLDSTTTVGAALPGNGQRLGVGNDTPGEWGKAVRQDAKGRNSLYEQDLGGGNKAFTFVVWAE